MSSSNGILYFNNSIMVLWSGKESAPSFGIGIGSVKLVINRTSQ